MSPAYVLEPTYDTLRRRILTGAWPSGHRIEAARVAAELGVSVTPVRDSLNRLAGERLVHASPGAGYQVPLLDETELRGLVDWHHGLVSIALRSSEAEAMAVTVPQGHDGVGERTALLFATIAGVACNRELDWTIANVAARLGAYRRHEEMVLGDALAELEQLELLAQEGDRNQLVQAVEHYHGRRHAAAAELVHAARSADVPDE